MMEEHPIKLLSAHIDGELSDAEATGLLAHLAGCPDCRRRLERLKLTKATLQSLEREDFPAERARMIPYIARNSGRFMAIQAVAAMLILGLSLTGGYFYLTKTRLRAPEATRLAVAPAAAPESAPAGAQVRGNEPALSSAPAAADSETADNAAKQDLAASRATGNGTAAQPELKAAEVVSISLSRKGLRGLPDKELRLTAGDGSSFTRLLDEVNASKTVTLGLGRDVTEATPNVRLIVSLRNGGKLTFSETVPTGLLLVGLGEPRTVANEPLAARIRAWAFKP